MHVSKRNHENCNRTEKGHVFHHKNIAYLNRFVDESQSYDNHTEDTTFDLLV